MASGKAHVGKPAPGFHATAVVDGAFKEIKLSDYKGERNHLKIIAFSERAEDFRKLRCEVLGVSVDSHFTHLAWVDTPRKEGGLGAINIPLLSDLTRQMAADYGVLKEDEGITYRGLFIIDDKGLLRQITVNDLPVGRSVEEVLRLVQAFQYTDTHGEVCPAGWHPGSDTIKPTVKDSKEYFAKQH
uniref:Peroxiredoxin-2 n=1 Tax=Chrysemys picta bellii TaxID=8478 RepID=A0A8C3IHX0_CHRPI